MKLSSCAPTQDLVKTKIPEIAEFLFRRYKLSEIPHLNYTKLAHRSFNVGDTCSPKFEHRWSFIEQAKCGMTNRGLNEIVILRPDAGSH